MVDDKTKIKKKKWVTILAPKVFNKNPVGDISLVDPSLAVGRTLKVNLMTLTGDFKKQNTEIGLKIVGMEDGKALTEMISYKLIPSSMRRLVRRGKEKVDYVFDCITSDNKKVTVKIFLITRFDVNKSVLTALRKSIKQILVTEVKKMTYDNFIGGLISKNIQRELSKMLVKIYPLKITEIREANVKGIVKGEIKVEEKVEEPKKEEESKSEDKPKEEKKVEAKKEVPKVEEKKEVKEAINPKKDLKAQEKGDA
jgi:small subunit ribosomal protein S3Ae